MASILVVDDDGHMRRLMRAVLERRGHRVSEARDGHEGLMAFEAEEPDLVITDAHMPGMDGVALAAALTGRARPPRILLVSGDHARAAAGQAALAEGRAGVLGKPFTPAELGEAVRALIGETGPAGGDGAARG